MPEPAVKRSGRIITLESSDGKHFALQHYETLPSKLVQDAIDDDDDYESDASSTNSQQQEENSDSNSPQTIIPLVNVKSDTLQHIIAFLNHHAIEPLNPITAPLATSSFPETITQEWYLRFIQDLPSEMIFKLVNAANYMDISVLLNLTCLKVSFDLMDKNAEEIRQILNLPKLSKEEEDRARVDHPWMFEDS